VATKSEALLNKEKEKLQESLRVWLNKQKQITPQAEAPLVSDDVARKMQSRLKKLKSDLV
jgi:hypothetical protein